MLGIRTHVLILLQQALYGLSHLAGCGWSLYKRKTDVEGQVECSMKMVAGTRATSQVLLTTGLWPLCRLRDHLLGEVPSVVAFGV